MTEILPLSAQGRQREGGVRTYSGTVTDAQGNPLPGAGIVIKGTAKGTTADLIGRLTVSRQ